MEASPSFATSSAQLRTLLLMKWLKASQGALLMLSAPVTVTHILTTGLMGCGYCKSTLVLF